MERAEAVLQLHSLETREAVDKLAEAWAKRDPASPAGAVSWVCWPNARNALDAGWNLERLPMPALEQAYASLIDTPNQFNRVRARFEPRHGAPPCQSAR